MTLEHPTNLVEELSKRTPILQGENPVFSETDILRIAARAIPTFRYAQNGQWYDVRFADDERPVQVHLSNLNNFLINALLMRLPPPQEEDTQTQGDELPPPPSQRVTKRKRSTGG